MSNVTNVVYLHIDFLRAQIVSYDHHLILICLLNFSHPVTILPHFDSNRQKEAERW